MSKNWFTTLMMATILQEAIEQEMRISGSDMNVGRISSDQNLPITDNTGNDSSSHGSDAFSRLNRNVSYLTKLESLASSAVRSADKVGAKLIIVYTQTGLCFHTHLTNSPREERRELLAKAA